MEQQPIAADAATLALPATPDRRDAFTAELMARFCEVLAETGIVTDACRAVGRSRDTAYTWRRRNPLFAAAWAAALSHARNRLADALLARSLEGSVDYLYRDGELVGERRYIDNRLAYAMLRRLDRQAETDPAPVAAELARQPAKARPEFDFQAALKALRIGSEEDLCAALANLDAVEESELGPPKGHDSDNSDNPPNPDDETVGVVTLLSGNDRVWETAPGVWWTNYPPPPGFDGEEKLRWDDEDYERECTPAECASLDAGRDADLAGYRAQEEAERDAFFAELAADVAEARAEATHEGAD